MQQHERDALALVIDRQIASRVEDVFATVMKRIDDIERKSASEGDKSVEQISSLRLEVAECLSSLSSIDDKIKSMPMPKDGIDGKDVDMESVIKVIVESVGSAVDEAVKSIPAPRNGVDGKDVDLGVVDTMVKTAVSEAVKAIPAPRDGDRGADGVGVAGAVIDRSGSLILTMSNGEAKSLGRIVGDDGLGFDDLSIEYDGERDVTLSFSKGDRVKSATLSLPMVIDRGVWKERSYEQGDGVTWRGSFWIAQSKTLSKPDESSSDWRLAVKRGRDGKDAVRGNGDVISAY